MKQVIAILASVVAFSAFAQPAKTPIAAEPAKPAVTAPAPVKSEVKKDEKKPVKSKEHKKAQPAKPAATAPATAASK